MNANKQDAGGLPELPVAVAWCEPSNPFRDDAFAWAGIGKCNYHTDPLYTADQIRAYGEQCRAASVASDDAIGVLEMIVDGRISGRISEWPQIKPAISEVLRALSRGVPERDSSDPERYRILRDWFLRGGKFSEILPAGHVKRYSEAEFDAEIDRIRAIAAQRKEG